MQVSWVVTKIVLDICRGSRKTVLAVSKRYLPMYIMLLFLLLLTKNVKSAHLLAFLNKTKCHYKHYSVFIKCSKKLFFPTFLVSKKMDVFSLKFSNSADFSGKHVSYSTSPNLGPDMETACHFLSAISSFTGGFVETLKLVNKHDSHGFLFCLPVFLKLTEE